MSLPEKLKNQFPSIILFAAALLFRVGHVLLSLDADYYQNLYVDAMYFDRYAWKIVTGAVQEDVLRVTLSPVYLSFLSLIYFIFGHSVLAVKLIQCVIGGINVVLIYAIGSAVWDRKTGILAGAVAAAYGIFIFYSAEILKPVLINFACLSMLYLLVRTQDRTSMLMCAAAGVAFGMAVLLRMHLLLFLPLILVWMLFFTGAKRGKAILGIILFSVVLNLTVMSFKMWFGRYVPKQGTAFSQSGIHFYIGNNETTRGAYKKLADVRSTPLGHNVDGRKAAEEAMGQSLSQKEVNRYWINQGLTYIRENPLDWIVLELKKLFLLFNKYEIPSFENYDYVRKKSSWILKLPLPAFALVSPLGLLGIYFCLRNRSKRAWPLLIFTFCYAAALLLIFIRADYRLPMVPPMILFAAYGAFELKKRLSVPSPQRIVLILALAGLVCFTNYGTFLNRNYYEGVTDKMVKKHLKKSAVKIQTSENRP